MYMILRLSKLKFSQGSGHWYKAKMLPLAIQRNIKMLVIQENFKSSEFDVSNLAYDNKLNSFQDKPQINLDWIKKKHL